MKKEMIKTADLILLILDGSNKLEVEDKEIFDLIKNKKVLVVVNKTDLDKKLEITEIPFESVMMVSAEKKQGITELKQKIYDMVIDENIMSGNIIITNSRHISSLDKSIESMKSVIESLENQVPLELVTVDINSVWLALGEITGETNNEEIINSIFMNFCVGK